MLNCLTVLNSVFPTWQLPPGSMQFWMASRAIGEEFSPGRASACIIIIDESGENLVRRLVSVGTTPCVVSPQEARPVMSGVKSGPGAGIGLRSRRGRRSHNGWGRPDRPAGVKDLRPWLRALTTVPGQINHPARCPNGRSETVDGLDQPIVSGATTVVAANDVLTEGMAIEDVELEILR